MAKRGKKRRRLDPEAVIRGEVSLDSDELLALIAEVNPTGRDLSPRLTGERYRQKSRLQSLLIRRWGEHLRVLPDPTSTERVTLVHAVHARDACHAVIAELDDEARSWVRARLDAGPTPAEGATRRADPGEARHETDAGAPEVATRTTGGFDSADAAKAKPDTEAGPPGAATVGAAGVEDAGDDRLLAEGRAALIAYDYERSRQLLTAAVKRAPGDPAPAEALLELLVDHLAAYDDALELDLDDAVGEMPAIRALRAVAAARSGLAETVAALTDRVDHPRAREALIVAARESLAAGKAEVAAGLLGRAALVHDGDDPTVAAELAELNAKLGEIRAAERRPLERALEAQLDRGDLDAAEREAQALLERWPDSRVAATVLAKIDRARALSEAEALATQSREAAADDRLAEATQLMQRALARVGEQSAWTAELEQLEARRRERRAEQARAETLARLAAEEPLDGLIDYLGLPEEQRRAVRAATPRDELEWLEELGTGSAGNQRRAAEAVLALRRARDALDDGRADEALETIAAHRKLLARHAVAQALIGRAEREQESQRREAAAATLGALARASEAGDRQRAEAELRRLDRARLSEEQRRLADELSARHAVATRRARGLEAIERLIEAGELLAARDAAGELMADLAAEERAAWRARTAELDAAIRTEWRLALVRGEAPPWNREHLPGLSGPAICLATGGDRFATAMAADRWVFVSFVDTTSGRVDARLIARTPEPLGVCSVGWVDDRLWLIGSRGRLLELSCADWTIRSWRNVADLIGPDHALEPVCPPLDGRFLWGHWEGSGESSPHQPAVIDLARHRVQSSLETNAGLTPLVGVDPPAMVQVGKGENARVWSLPARPIDLQLPAVDFLDDLEAVPGGGLLVLSHAWNHEGLEERHLRLSWTSGDGRHGESLALDDALHGFIHEVASARAAGSTFLITRNRAKELRLRALEVSGDGIREVYAVDLPDSATLVRDAGGERVILVANGRDGPQVLRLSGREPPKLAPSPPRAGKPLWLDPAAHCHPVPDAEEEELATIVRALRDGPAQELAARVDALGAAHSQEPVALARYLVAIGRADKSPGAYGAEVARWALAQYPADPEVRLAAAGLLALREHWLEAGRALIQHRPEDLPERLRQHFCHLLGLATYLAGDREAGVAIVEDGVRFVGHCGLADLAAGLRPAEPTAGQPSSTFGELVTRVAAADERLAAGDHCGAIELLRPELEQRLLNVRVLARAADAYLRAADSTVDPLEKARTLARLLDRGRIGELWRAPPLNPTAPWEAERINAVRDGAQAWLNHFAPGAL